MQIGQNGYRRTDAGTNILQKFLCTYLNKIFTSQGSRFPGFEPETGGFNTCGSKNISTKDCYKRMRPTQNPS